MVHRLALAGIAAAIARAGWHAGQAARWSDRLRTVNYRGRPVSLAAGPALGLAASLTAAAGAPRLAGPALLAGLGGAVAGCYDDVAGAAPEQRAVKGVPGHLRALRSGRLTTGVVKLAVLGASGLAAAALMPPTRAGGRGRLFDAVLAGGVIAGTANLVNLFDLRPGRALKAGLLVGLPLVATASGGVAAGPVGAAAALLPDDLGERAMLGDAGANALGALLGLALAAPTGRAGRAGLLAGLAALTLVGDRISLGALIDANPGLRAVDRVGRRA